MRDVKSFPRAKGQVFGSGLQDQVFHITKLSMSDFSGCISYASSYDSSSSSIYFCAGKNDDKYKARQRFRKIGKAFLKMGQGVFYT